MNFRQTQYSVIFNHPTTLYKQVGGGERSPFANLNLILDRCALLQALRRVDIAVNEVYLSYAVITS